MKNKVKFSIYALALTAIFIALTLGGLFMKWPNLENIVIYSVIIDTAIIAGLYFCPISVVATRSEIKLHRLLGKPKVFYYDDIQGVEICYPSAGGLRLCGSGGFFGYWGYFSDIIIGTYFGYYGSRSHCFLVKLKNGKQYVLGCENPKAMIDYINSQIEK